MDSFRHISLIGAIAAILVVSPSAGWPDEAIEQSANSNPVEKKAPAGTDVVRITPEGVFDLHLQGADLRMVLRQLSLQSKRNIIASKEVSGEITADLHGVTFTQALEAILYSSGLVSQKKENFIYVFTPKELAAIEKAKQKVDVRVFRLGYLTAKDAESLIKNVLSPDGIIALTPPPKSGIKADTDTTGGKDHAADEIIVVRDYEENLEKVAQILAEIDIRPQQVLVEATILSAELDDNSALGIDLQVLTGVDFQTFGVTSDLANMVVPPPPVGGVKDFNNTQTRINTNFSANLPIDLGSPMTFGIISNNVAAFIHALEAVTDVTVLANPKLLIVNKQRGEVLVGRSDGYLTTTTTETTTTETVEFLETGTRLIVRPFVGNDGYVRMEIHPEDSTGSVIQVGGVGGPVLPNKTTTEITSNIMVRDGKTIVIGGLFREQTNLVRRQVPLLGDIPWAGTLFRSTVDVMSRHEVIILITPHIIDYPSAEAVGQRMKMDAERYRIGGREGMQWWSRIRLADKHLFWARQAMAENSPDRAMWYVDLALSLEPRMPEAINLKERLSDQAYWADQPENITTRYFVERMIMQELDKPYGDVLPPGRPLQADKINPEVRKAFGIKKRPGDSGEGLYPPGDIRPAPGVQTGEDKTKVRPVRGSNGSPR